MLAIDVRSPAAKLYCSSTPIPMPRLLKLVLAGLAIGAVPLLAGALQPAAAQQGLGNLFSYNQPAKKRVVRKKRTPSAKQAAPTQSSKKANETKGAVYAVVSLPDQHITVYDATGRIAQSRISSGKAGKRTPTGVFSVIGKKRFHRSNLYSGAPMPWMQRITWSGIALHAGVIPGYPASHGCIRLPNAFAPKLYSLTSMGARIIVSPGDVKPEPITHAILPTPKMQMAPAADQQASAPEKATVELASTDASSAAKAAAAAAGEPALTPGDEGNQQPALLNPIAYAAALKKQAEAERSAADALSKEALASAQQAGAEARAAADALSKAEATLEQAKEKLAATSIEDNADAPESTASTGSTTAPAPQLVSDVDNARAALDEARTIEAQKSQAAFDAVEAYKRADEAAKAAASRVAEAERRRKQVSVFVSKKEGKIFVRQDWKAVWEAPITIRDPERPIGTHVYTAVDVEADGSKVHWAAVSMPPETAKAKPARRGGKGAKAAATEPSPTFAPETATGALDRIEMPEGARDLIGELLWTGGSLIVSDHPRSHEMGDYTDFIVLTR